ncbi:unnamed protein product, partial [Brassica rapa subsp. trilocularis]
AFPFSFIKILNSTRRFFRFSLLERSNQWLPSIPTSPWFPQENPQAESPHLRRPPRRQRDSKLRSGAPWLSGLGISLLIIALSAETTSWICVSLYRFVTMIVDDSLDYRRGKHKRKGSKRKRKTVDIS